MTPQQEADNLLQQLPKDHALILVDRILNMELAWEFKDSAEVWGSEIDCSREYWEEVKRILEQ